MESDLIDRAIEETKSKIYYLKSRQSLSKVAKRYVQKRIEIHETIVAVLEKHKASAPVNRGGIPEFGYCPDCGEAVTKTANPVCCKWCMKKLDWEGTNER